MIYKAQLFFNNILLTIIKNETITKVLLKRNDKIVKHRLEKLLRGQISNLLTDYEIRRRIYKQLKQEN